MILLRNIAFYLAFYLGSVVLVSRSVIALLIAPHTLYEVIKAWPRWQRTCLKHIIGMNLRIEGQPLDEPAFYAFKHESFFEAIDVPLLIEKPVIFAKEELFRIPGWGRAARHYGIIPVSRTAGASALRAMFTALRGFTKEGRSVVIFPEGTRVPHGASPELRSGFAGLYKQAKLPVVPVAVYSGPLYHRWLKRPGTIIVRFTEAIPAGLPRDEIEARTRAGMNALN